MPPRSKVPPPGNKKDEYTNFMTKMKWKQAFQKPDLEIAGRNIRPQGCLIITNALLKNKTLTRVDFSHNHLGDDGAVHFAQLLKVNQSIRTVNLACNEISDVGGIALASAFIPSANPSGQPSQWNRTVWYFNLSGNNLKDDTLVAFSNAVTCNTDFTELDLTFNKIGPQGTKVLSRTMTRNNMCGIRLAANSLGDEGCQYLCDAWRRYGSKGTQRMLDLARNNLGQGAGEHIGNLLAGNTFVMDLVLQQNTLGAKGAKGIFAPMVLSVSACLRVINLFDNFIGDEGAEELARYLALDTTVEIVNVAKNSIGDKGGAALFAALHKCSRMNTVYANANRFSSVEIVRHINDRLRSTKTIRLIDVKENVWTAEARRMLANVKDIPPVTYLNPDKDNKQEMFEPRVDYDERNEDITKEMLLEKLATMEQQILDDELKFSMKKGKKRGSSAKKK